MTRHIPMQQTIRKHLKQLVGLQLSIARLAGGMRNFQFGPIRAIKKGTVATFALHIQCPWRIEVSDGILTGSDDLWRPIPEFRRPDWKFHEGTNIQELRLGELLKGYDPVTRSYVNRTNLLFVERIKVNAIGDATLFLSGNYRLVIFLDSTTTECWRLFRPGSKRHFVVGKD